MVEWEGAAGVARWDAEAAWLNILQRTRFAAANLGVSLKK